MRIILLLLLLVCCLAPALAVPVSGVVYGRDGLPLAGARIFSGEGQEVRTDAGGTFTITCTPPRDNPLALGGAVIYAPGYALTQISLRAGGNIVLLQREQQVSGKVIDTAGQPIAGVRVLMSEITPGQERYIAIPEHLRDQFAARTNAEGRWTISGVPAGGKAVVALESEDYVYARADIALCPEEALTILRRGGIMVGRVLDVLGKPLKGCRVLFHEANGDAFDYYLTSGEHGAYCINGLKGGVYDVMLFEEIPAGTAVALRGLRVEEGQATPVPDLRLVPPAIVAGRVYDAETGKPLPGLGIRCQSPDRPDIPNQFSGIFAVPGETTTDARGEFTLHVAPGDGYVYLADPPKTYLPLRTPREEGQGRFPFTVKPGGTVVLKIPLSRGQVLHGTAVDEQGKAVPGVRIGVKQTVQHANPEVQDGPNALISEVVYPGDPAPSNTQGAFTLSGLYTGKAMLLTTGTDQPPTWEVVSPKEIDLPVKAPVTVVLHRIPTEQLTGRVVTPTGVPIPHVRVQVNIEIPRGSQYCGVQLTRQSGSDGCFQLPELPNNTPIGISDPRKPGYRFIFSGGVVIKNGDKRAITDIVMAPLDDTLTGQVRDAAGLPVMDAVVLAVQAHGEVWGKTDVTGHFTLENLYDGPVTVFAAIDRQWAQAQATLPGGPVALTLVTPPPLPAWGSPEARALLTRLLQAVKTVRTSPEFPATVAAIDPDLALSILRDQPGVEADDGLACIIAALGKAHPAVAPPQVANIHDPNKRACAAARLAAALVGVDNAAATALFRQAKAQVENPTGAAALYACARLAAVSARLHLGEEDALLTRIGEALTKDTAQDYMRCNVAAMLAQACPALLTRLPLKTGRNEVEYAERVLQALPVEEYAFAQRLIAEMHSQEPTPETKFALFHRPPADFSTAKLIAIRKWSAAHPDDMLALARSVQDANLRATALLLAAEGQPAPTALPLLREAFTHALERWNYDDLAAIAAAAALHDATVGQQLFTILRTKSLQAGGLPILNPAVLFRCGDFSPAESRLLLERNWFHHHTVNEETVAMAPIDMERTLAMITTLPENSEQRWKPIARCIQYLLASPAQRRTMPLQNWHRPADSWLPGDEMGW